MISGLSVLIRLKGRSVRRPEAGNSNLRLLCRLRTDTAMCALGTDELRQHAAEVLRHLTPPVNAQVQ
jgi:hypothetical protein